MNTINSLHSLPFSQFAGIPDRTIVGQDHNLPLETGPLGQRCDLPRVTRPIVTHMKNLSSPVLGATHGWCFRQRTKRGLRVLNTRVETADSLGQLKTVVSDLGFAENVVAESVSPSKIFLLTTRNLSLHDCEKALSDHIWD
ncbi:hypothetical protein PanWU01x14_156610 [Parasponia andersonii]|uniref:Uncharacterized protein n=1 Tax=Parasponia andersonii TaxID=3476 RepID=A0A2P5CFW6_PARAD|nr:hypothetical protein PanWU01x14_156610 [Parasponia andersonii]